MVGACNKNGYYYAFKQGDLTAGPVWRTQIVMDNVRAGACIAAATWDGTNLVEGGGSATTIGGVTYDGSLQSLNPATGVPVWQTGINGQVVGTPTEDGAGLIAAQVYYASSGDYFTYLVNAATGAIVDEIPVSSGLFGQPTFANNDLLIGGQENFGLTAYAITTPGPPLTRSSPTGIQSGETSTITVTGSGFTATPTVMVSGYGASTVSVTVVSSTELKVSIYVVAGSASGQRNLSVTEPNGTASSCTSCIHFY